MNNIIPFYSTGKRYSNINTSPNNSQFQKFGYNIMNNSQQKNITSGITKINNKIPVQLSQEKNNDITKLEHKLIESTTEDSDHPLRELSKGLKGVGWFSSRFSQYPQEIYIQFSQPVLLRQINMVIHEKNIPSPRSVVFDNTDVITAMMFRFYTLNNIYRAIIATIIYNQEFYGGKSLIQCRR